MKLQTIDVPRADSLTLVRRLVEAIRRSPSRAAKDLAEATGFSERHVRYRLAAARILGFVGNEDLDLTSRAERLLATTIGSDEEKVEMRRAVMECRAVRIIAPDLLERSEVDIAKLTKKIAAASGLSQATAERRAGVLRSWHRDLQ